MGAHIRIVLLTVPDGDAEVAADALWEAGAAAVEERPGPSPGTATLVADVEPAARREGWSVAVQDVDDGRDAWRAHAVAWRAGPFVVRPAWLPSPSVAPGAVELVIDPGHAFGSGSHPTTRLVLAAVGELVTPATTVLDVGCGSGVLAVAAARLGARAVDAVDVDPEAAAATTANAAANGVAVRLAALDDLPGPYDVVLANIGAATLRALAPELEERAVPGGAIVLSGLLGAQVAGVTAAFTGCTVESAREEDGWAAVVLRRGAPRPGS